MPAKKKSFLDRVRKVPGFGFADELNELVDRHGPDTPELLQAVIDAQAAQPRRMPAGSGRTPSVLPTSIRLPRSSPTRRWRNCRMRSPERRSRSASMSSKAFSRSPWRRPRTRFSCGGSARSPRCRSARSSPPAREIADAIAIHYSNDKDIGRASARSSASTSSTGRIFEGAAHRPGRKRLADPGARFDHLLRHPRTGDRHPHRAAGTAVAHPLPRRRHAARGADVFAQASPGAHLPPQDSLHDQHHRIALSPGRPLHDGRRRREPTSASRIPTSTARRRWCASWRCPGGNRWSPWTR
jgi:hypothetical protein